MKFANLIPLFSVLILSTTTAQEKIKSFDFKKGEVLDIILISQTEEGTKLFGRYKETAFPVAFEYSYQPQPGFGVSKLTLGTGKPDGFLFGKWGSLEKREGFLENIVKRVPDFHQQRRDIFSDFRLAYYEIKQDLKFSVDTSKYNVVTSLWDTAAKMDSSFFKNWKAEVVKSGGKVLVTLENGTSPIGYVYDPNVMCITEWQSESDFKAFAQKHALTSYGDLYSVHQFVIQ